MGGIYESTEGLPSTFDFIVVGGGTAGNVLANRLTEVEGFSVLLLEAGPTDAGVQASNIPLMAKAFQDPANPLTWGYTTTQLPGLGGRSIVYPRGRMLGGCTSINYMCYTRCASEDFDRIAKVTGDEGWSWNSLMPYFDKNERWSHPESQLTTTMPRFDPTVHSKTGVIPVRVHDFPQGIDDYVVKVSQELPDEFPYNPDHNSGNVHGVAWLHTMTTNGERATSSLYLSPDVLARPNLHVLLNAQVTRLIQTEDKNGMPSFRSVEFVQNKEGLRHVVMASKEVILSAGSIGSPHILLNSGIGDKQELESVGVTPALHVPDVGKNLSDHPMTVNVWSVNSTDTLDTFSRNQAMQGSFFMQWMKDRTGRFSQSGLGNHAIWGRIPDNIDFVKGKDPSPSPSTPQWEILPANCSALNFEVPPTGNYVSMVTIVLSPVSRGSITLTSSNPFDKPLIDPGLLKDDFDVQMMKEAIKGAEKFVSAPAWKDYIIAPHFTLADAHKSEEHMKRHIQEASTTIFHPLGSNSMSKKGEKKGVVDPDLKVKGVDGLRIVDGSVIPFPLTGHPVAPIYALAERAADLIKASWKA